jgi:ribosomal-protein-alanine N-acetyltransferase
VKLSWATDEMAPALAAAHATAFPAPWSAAEFRDLLASPGVFGFLAEEGTPQAMILCRVAAGEVEVLTLAVAPERRRQGVGRELVRAAMDAARHAGAEAAFLEVAADNPAAAALYASLGFRRAGLRRAYYDRGPEGRVDALVMRLDLNGAAP